MFHPAGKHVVTSVRRISDTLVPHSNLRTGAAVAGFIIVIISWYGMMRVSFGLHISI